MCNLDLRTNGLAIDPLKLFTAVEALEPKEPVFLSDPLGPFDTFTMEFF